MKKLCDLVSLDTNSEEMVILVTKSGVDAIDLIRLGFLGDERMFRLTKGATHICTIWRPHQNVFSWSWGVNGTAVVSEDIALQGKKIQDCIEKEFGIYIGEKSSVVSKTLYTELGEDKKTAHLFKMYSPSKSHMGIVTVKRDGVPFSQFPSRETFLDYLEDHFGEIVHGKKYTTENPSNYVEEFLTNPN